MGLLSWLSANAALWLDAFHNANFGFLFGNPLTILTLCLLLALWAGGAAVRLRRGTNRLVATLSAARVRLDDTPNPASSFAIQFDRVSSDLADMTVIGPSWRDWCATLITPDSLNRPVRSTIRPANYLSLGLLRKCGINPRLHAAMPNLLVGVGLLFTFFGLSVALQSAGSIASPNAAAEQRNIGLKGLLDAASAKFWTSLIGLFCSIAYSAFRSRCLDKAERALDDFLVALEERIPLATAASLQSETNSTLERSLQIQDGLAQQLAFNLSPLLDQALDSRLGEHIGPLRSAIEQLAESIGTRDEDTLRAMLEEFLATLRGGTDKEMANVVAALAGIASGMSDMQDRLAKAASDMQEAAREMGRGMGQGAQETIGQISEQMRDLVDQMKAAAAESQKSGDDAMRQAAERMQQAGAVLAASAQATSTEIQNAMVGLTERISANASQATDHITDALREAVATLQRLAADVHGAGDTATQDLARQLGLATSKLEATVETISSTLATGTNDAAGKLSEILERMEAQFGQLAEGINRDLRSTTELVTTRGQASAEALAAAANQAAEALRTGGEDAGKSLQKAGDMAAQHLDRATHELAAPARELGQRVLALQAEGAALSSALAAMRQASIDATAPLRATAADLVDASASTAQAAGEMGEASRRIAPVTDSLDAVTRRLVGLERQFGDLSDQLSGAVDRFQGLEGSMAGVFQQLDRGVSGFARQVHEFVGKTNSDMATALGTISAAISELTEVLEGVAPGSTITRP